MPIEIPPSGGYEVPAPGTYRARIIEVEECESLNPDWPKQLLCRVEVDTTDSQGQPMLIHHYVSQKFSPMSKLGKMVSGVLNRMPNDYSTSNPLNTEELIDVECGVLIDVVERQDGGKRAIISAWLPADLVGKEEPPVWEQVSRS
tara:strand:+ start:3648 stop:4082 length:435 start_codon:yes stop_codon:yes gene_type:complete